MTTFYPESPNKPEEWRPVKNFPWYEVSNYGRVVSYIIRNQNHFLVADVPQRFMKWSILSNGYPSVHLGGSEKSGTKLIHRLVAEAFLGPCPPGMQVCHYDGNRTNPFIGNLRYDTVQGNMNDTHRHGRMPYGEDKSLAKKYTKLTNAKVEEIRCFSYDHPELTYREIGGIYGLASSRIGSIVRRTTWKKIGGPQTRKGTTVVNEQIVREMRELYNAGGTTCLLLAKKYGICKATARQIVRRVTWKHVE